MAFMGRAIHLLQWQWKWEQRLQEFMDFDCGDPAEEAVEVVDGEEN